MPKNINISLKHSVVQSEGTIVSDMDTEKVMLSIRNGKYYNLGEIGGKIWDLIAVPTPVFGLINELISEYDVESDECEGQVISFLEHLLEEDLIRASEVINS